MKHVLLASVVVVALLMFCGTAGAQIFGNPSATLDQGEMSLGISGGYEARNISAVDRGILDYGCAPYDHILSYGAFDWLEVFFKIGIHHPHLSHMYTEPWGEEITIWHINSTEPGIGMGARLTLYENGDFSVGWLNQLRMDWPSDRFTPGIEQEGFAPGQGPVSHRFSARVTQFDTMIGSALANEGGSIYLGLLGSFVGGSLTVKASEGDLSDRTRNELHDDAFGGVLGGSIKIMDDVYFGVESSGMSSGWSISGGVKMIF